MSQVRGVSLGEAPSVIILIALVFVVYFVNLILLLSSGKRVESLLLAFVHQFLNLGVGGDVGTPVAIIWS